MKGDNSIGVLLHRKYVLPGTIISTVTLHLYTVFLHFYFINIRCEDTNLLIFHP